MDSQALRSLLDSLLAEGTERQWLEFKDSFYEPKMIGDYLSALSNSACLAGRGEGYLVFGVDDKTLDVVGTSFKPAKKKVGSQHLELWLNQMLSPKPGFSIHEFDYSGKPVVLFIINAASGQPVSFEGRASVRIDSSKTSLHNHPELQRRIWTAGARDWSAEFPLGATLADLDEDALAKARAEYKVKHQTAAFCDEVDAWSDETFLNKSRLTVDGRLTNAAIILLGKPESVHLIQPSVARMTWIIKDLDGIELDYAHFDPPLITGVDRLLGKIRNLKLRVLPDGTLFPVEITQYDPWVMREALHNCIAHQDYRLCARITVVENPTSLLFVNSGAFLPGSVRNVLRQDAPQRYYPNRLLAEAMVNLNMIDTIGSGIRRMFSLQKSRFMPMPDFDLTTPDEVRVRLEGRVLDENYTKLLMNNPDLTLDQVVLLDHVQKAQKIAKDEHRELKKAGLVEGRYPRLQVAAEIAQATENKVDYTRKKAFDDRYYKDLILSFLDHHGEARPKELQELVMDKLSDLLDEKQRKDKVRNLLQQLVRSGHIENVGMKARGAIWKRIS